MYKIVAKAEMKADIIKDRLERGADSIEIQLLSRPTDDLEMILPYADKIETVHSTLHQELKRSVDFEDIDEWANENLEDAFRLAQALSEGKRMVGVVIHVHTDLEYIKKYNFVEAMSRLELMLKKYRNVYVLLENGMIVAYGHFYPLSADGFAETVHEVKRLSNFSDRVFALIDTTHSKSNSMIESYIRENISWTDLYTKWFSNVSDMLKEVHFANCINKGINGSEHGVDFYEDDPDSLEFFDFSMRMVNKYIPDNLLCLEVYEKDYYHAENFSHIKNMIERYNLTK